ncbi:MAG: CDP-alcohol phosphatidyltransferase family protein [Clostridium sp.]|uniref:CDP-alcohol phosphatidyltransferase family protein n=1 Tax=Clostridium sp. TaxID=1506 RepID=UPI002FC82BF3
MLDTYGRRYFNPLIDYIGDKLLKINLTPNNVTIIALFIGILTFPLILYKQYILGTIVLWISGLLDAVDGSMARKSNCKSDIGALMDITFDRIVELSVLLGLAINFSEARLYLLILLASILISMTIFLTVAAGASNKGIKSFHYQTGLAERTEGFIMFSLMMVFNNYINIIACIFSSIIIFTIVQRALEARKLLK